MRRNIGVGVQGKAVDTGTAGSFEFRPVAFIAKARADASHLLVSPFPKDDAPNRTGQSSPSGQRIALEVPDHAVYQVNPCSAIAFQRLIRRLWVTCHCFSMVI